MKNHTGEKETKEDPYKGANILSKIIYWWILPLLWKGFKEDIKKTDINEQIANLNSEELTNKFYVKWQQMKNNGSKSIIKLLFHFYGTSFFISTIIQVTIEVLSKVVQVICLGGLTSFFSVYQNNTTNFEAYVYASGLVISIFFLSLSTNFYTLFVTRIGLKIRLGCSGLVYKKILENKTYISGFNGKAIQILTNDMRQLIFALIFFNFVILGPAETCALGYLMYQEIGLSAICGIVTCLIFLPCQVLSSRFAGKFLQAKSKHTDLRLKLLTEVIQGIQVIKMYSWENWFYNSLVETRKTELKKLWGTLKIRAGVNSLRMVSVIAIFVSLLSHIYFGNQLSARKVFITSLVFTLINSSMIRFWTTSLTYCSEAFVSANRINDFLLAGLVFKKNNVSDETRLINKDPDTPVQEISYTKIDNERTKILGIWLNNIIVKRKKEQEDEIEKTVLNNINLKINGNNNLIAIVGPVGSSKSTLLNLILGEVEIESGSIEVNGTISYASQQPWIFEGTIQENILFTEILDENRYAEVIKVCALEKDIENLPQKHLTHIGERGANLSGGQKARINLARAIYKKADIYLLDDPFSAVDAEVGHYIFDKCVSTFLSGKICLLVTHQIIYLTKNVNQIIVMTSGCIKLQDSLNNLQNLNELNDELHFFYNSPEAEKSVVTENKILNGTKNEHISDNSNQEQSETGSIKWTIYRSLMKLIGCGLAVSTLLMAVVSTISLNGLSYFLRNWVDWEESQTNSTNVDYVKDYRHNYELEYSFVVAGALILNTIRYFMLSYVCLKISRNIFISLLEGVIQANTYFFNLNSSGRIINRFSNDLGLIDSQLSISLQYIVALLTDVPAAAIVVSIINPWLLIPSIAITVAFYLIRQVYIKTSRNMKRIDALSQSPINSHVNETFQGLATIRIQKGEVKMTTKFHKYQDFSVSTYFLDSAIYRGFTVWIETFCTLYIGIIAFTFITHQHIFTSGDVGLAIFLCMSTVQTLQFAIKFSANFENQLTSVERIIEYANQPNEATLNTPKTREKEINWPTAGAIEFTNFSLRYGPNTNSILKNINIKIKAKEKIGIVGRTGSGKSSIIQAIFRLVFNEGKIEIDGYDINNLDLHDLRSKISIIPQDPILFSGTIRTNLDPFKVLSDADLWKALEEVELKEHIKTLNKGLESIVREHGSNFSVGQRQLLCLARAILRNNKILILDEATANVDPETDKLIQKTIATKFGDSTILTITHRLESIKHCDRIMIVDNGSILQFDTFENLQNNSNNYFNKIF